MADDHTLRFCNFCGAMDPVRIGRCDVCERYVCDQCGNVQHVKGERVVMHDACLKDTDDDGFSMIRIVKD